MSPTDVPGTATAEWLQQYGPWALVVVCFSVILFLFRALSTARDTHESGLSSHTEEIKAIGAAHTEEIKSIGAEHKREMEVILNRLIETSNTQVREYFQLAEKVTAVIDALSRRIEGRSTPKEP